MSGLKKCIIILPLLRGNDHLSWNDFADGNFFHTANIIPSTFSVSTSFLAVYLSFRRSPYYALAYAANDLVLIVLWILASLENTSYISVTVCFIAFLANDLYGFWNWKKMESRQMDLAEAKAIQPL